MTDDETSDPFEDDLAALADVGFGPDHLDRLAESGFEPGQFAYFRSLDLPTRHLVLRLSGLLGVSTEEDFAALDRHPDGKAIAEWLLDLPGWRHVDDEETQD